MKLPVLLRRAGYRLAYAVLRVYWFLRRPHLAGVKCVITSGDRVLLVRHTYGHSEWDLPGGTVRRNEDPQLTARREMKEELGVCIDRWRRLGTMQTTIHHRRDTLHCFQAELDSGASIKIDLGELSTAGWFGREDLPDDLSRYVRPILARAAAAAR
jgi:8-oxo-dGTP pyrophosphatase MutT (NUDIX family)